MKKFFYLFFLLILVNSVYSFNETFGTVSGKFYVNNSLNCANYSHAPMADPFTSIGSVINSEWALSDDGYLTNNPWYCYHSPTYIKHSLYFDDYETTSNALHYDRFGDGASSVTALIYDFGVDTDFNLDTEFSYCGQANSTGSSVGLGLTLLNSDGYPTLSWCVGGNTCSPNLDYLNGTWYLDRTVTQLVKNGADTYGCLNFTLMELFKESNQSISVNWPTDHRYIYQNWWFPISPHYEDIRYLMLMGGGVGETDGNEVYLDNFGIDIGTGNSLPEFNISITSDECFNSTKSLDKINLDVNISTYDLEGDTIYYSFNNVRILNYTNLYSYTKPFCNDVICVNRPDHNIFLYKFYQPYSNTCGISENGDGDFNYALIDNSYWLQLWNCSGTDKSIYFKEDIQGDFPVYKFDIKYFDTYDYLQVSMLDGFMNDKIGFYITRPDNSTYVVWNYADTQIINFSWFKYDPIFINLVTNLTGSENVDLYISNTTGVMAQANLPFLTDVEFNGVLKLTINESTTLGNSYIATGWSYDEDIWSTSYDDPLIVDQHIHYRYYVKISDDYHYPIEYNYDVVDVYLPECKYKIDGLDIESEHFEDNNFNPFVLINTLLRKPFSNYLRQLDLDVVADGILGILVFIAFFMMLLITQNFSISIISVSLGGSFLSFLGNLNSFPVYVIMLSIGIATIVLRSFNGQ